MKQIDKTYELIIIGAGVAGYSASIYASRYKINHLLIGELPGGTITEAHKVGNYPGFVELIGIDLAVKMKEHAKSLGMEEKNIWVEAIRKLPDNSFEVKTKKEIYITKSIILATGTKRKRLGLPKEKEFLGKGVSYCAICDAMFYKNKAPAVVGGSNAAVMAASYLAQLASKVYLIYRGLELRAEPIWTDDVKNNPKIKILYNTNIISLNGDKRLESISIDKEFEGKKKIKLDGLFVEVGSGPETDLAKDLKVELDDKGYIKVINDQSTNVKGIYAAGDVTNGSNYFRQVITACSEGSIAANSVFKYLRSIK